MRPIALKQYGMHHASHYPSNILCFSISASIFDGGQSFLNSSIHTYTRHTYHAYPTAMPPSFFPPNTMLSYVTQGILYEDNSDYMIK